MGLRDIGDTLPPGFRFYPSDEELVCHYLSKKVANEQLLRGTLVEIDLHTCEPWQLPDVAKLNSNEWYFFSFRDRKYATGFRTNRATTSGYWKATGKDRPVLDPRTRAVVGMRKTLVFYKNRAPNGVKTGWIMHEFRLENPHLPPKEDWVLCRVFHKSRTETNSYSFNEDVYSPVTMGTTSSACVPVSQRNEHHHYPIPGDYHNNIVTPFTPSPKTPLGISAQDPKYNLSNQNHVHDQVSGVPVSNHATTRMVDQVNCEDEYGFLIDMRLDDLNAMPSSLGELRFGDDFV